MLNYLVRNESQRKVLAFLWGERKALTVSQVAKFTSLPYATVHRELAEMKRADLALFSRVGNATVYRSNRSHPQAQLVHALLESPKPKSSADPQLLLQLQALGMPLAVEGTLEEAGAVEETLAKALHLSHRDAMVARSLPVALAKNVETLDLDRLSFLARGMGERQTLGYFLELTSVLSGHAMLRRVAKTLVDCRVKRLRYFFVQPMGSFERKLTQKNTPALAKKWGFWMNLGTDSFQSHFDKFYDGSSKV